MKITSKDSKQKYDFYEFWYRNAIGVTSKNKTINACPFNTSKIIEIPSETTKLERLEILMTKSENFFLRI